MPKQNKTVLDTTNIYTLQLAKAVIRIEKFEFFLSA